MSYNIDDLLEEIEILKGYKHMHQKINEQNKRYREKLIEILKKEHEHMEGYETETFTLAKNALGLCEKEVIKILEGESSE